MPVVRYRVFDHWTMLTLLGVGAFMVWGAGHYTVFDDEGFSCRRYTMPLGEMVAALWHGEEPDPPLYYVLQNIWVHVFGVGPLGLRSLSIIMFLSGLIFIRLAGHAWYDSVTGLLAMVMAALHPAHLLLGLAGRWYSTMFCLVALLTWITGRLSRRNDREMIVAWSLAAAAVCYTNYFGPVIVAILWLCVALRSDDFRRWLKAAAGAVLLYLVWLPVFWHHATRFPQVTASWSKYADSALRLLMAFATGNLASITAWWVWAFVFICMVAGGMLAYLKIGGKELPGPLSQVVALCFLIGVISRTIIDKYLMTFSGLACLALAWMVRQYWPRSRDVRTFRLTRMAAISLGIAWLGCYVNLVTERHWSSLRWLDPYEQVISDLASGDDSPPPTDWVISQPAARYYYGCMMARRTEPTGTIPFDLWRRFAIPSAAGDSSAQAAATPESMLDQMKNMKPQRLLTLRGSEFADSPEWSDLQKILDEDYELVDEKTYLKDPEAKWKDRIDPTFKHPEWRITVRVYALRGGT